MQTNKLITKTTVSDIRSAFLSFFERNEHKIISSAPLIPHNDNTLLFTNAGMVPFKNYFTGVEIPPANAIASSQKCVRAGGKHNDLENVGYTARHHTFFEMLGNFSFGKYFKEEAISYAWDFLTKECKLDKNRLLFTVHTTDEESPIFWKKITGCADDRIIKIPTSDNFWMMGDTGPCGPCTEIFYDYGPDVDGDKPGTAGQDGNRFVEIWNLVFMMYNQQPDGSRINLPSPCVDTGMGLERISTVMQGVTSTYKTDIFCSLIKNLESIIGVKYNESNMPSFHAAADHIRSCSFLISDGIDPSNEGRGYVLRRIIRRAMRHIYQLGYKKPALNNMVDSLIDTMGNAYSELKRAESKIKSVLLNEEEKFLDTLDRGISMLDSRLNSDSNNVDGDLAFRLYETYGFPIDLTIDYARSFNKSVDVSEFERLFSEHQKNSKGSWKSVKCNLFENLEATKFLGYTDEKCHAIISNIFLDYSPVSKASCGDEVILVTNNSVFYGESGGQEGDVGYIKSDNITFKVSDTQKCGDTILHVGIVERGIINIGDKVFCEIDSDHRKLTRNAHSATHILHKAIRSVLGDSALQKGSCVGPNRIRFDYSYNKKPSYLDILSIENIVNNKIRDNSEVNSIVKTKEEAFDDGAMGLFGEKYGDNVRTVKMGDSYELCGGTHATRTGDIGFFKITKEEAVSSGVRRIEAITGNSVEEYIQKLENYKREITDITKSPDSISYINSLCNEVTLLKKQNTEYRRSISKDPRISIEISLGNNIKIYVCNKDDIEYFVDICKDSECILAISSDDIDSNKDNVVSFAVRSGKNFPTSAVDIARIFASLIEGKSGGRDMFARGGGKSKNINNTISNFVKHYDNKSLEKK
jgi:alanyl-tRNA synthetase